MVVLKGECLDYGEFYGVIPSINTLASILSPKSHRVPTNIINSRRLSGDSGVANEFHAAHVQH